MKEKISFLLVGGWNTVFGYFVFAVLYYLLSQRIHYLIIMMFSYVISITNAYFGYKYLVFKTKGNHLKEYVKFYMVYGVSLTVNIFLLTLLVEIQHFNPLLAQAIIVFFIAVISYFGHKYFSFKRNK